ncbi:MAG: YigZ family protein [bacterium]
MSQYFSVPAARVEHELVVKKSRFIAWIAPASQRDSAMALLDEAKAHYPDARHHCWAYVLGNPNNAASAAFSDDGEPGGTAGKPILNVIQHKGIGNTMVVVTRYFGGVKLGAGGLVRAYSAATQQATEQLQLIEQRPQTRVQLQFPYEHEPMLRHWLEQHHAQLDDSQYSTHVAFSLRLEEQHLPALSELIAPWADAQILTPDEPC